MRAKSLRAAFVALCCAVVLLRGFRLAADERSSPPQSSSVAIKLEAPKRVNKPSESVLIRLTVEVNGISNVLIFPGFAATVNSESPVNQLMFVVKDSFGNNVPHLGAPLPHGTSAEVVCSDFREMQPLTFFGRYFDLASGSFRYALKPGETYRVRAVLHLTAADYFHKTKDRKLAECLYPQRTLLVSGTIESNEIILKIERP